MTAMRLVSFRFAKSELKQLDYLVFYEQKKGPVLFPHSNPNRTQILKALIARECLRLEDEQAQIADRLQSIRQKVADKMSVVADLPETDKQRKGRLQRERRAGKSTQTA